MTQVSVPEGPVDDRAAAAAEWLADQIADLAVINVGGSGTPADWPALTSRMRVLSFDPLAQPADPGPGGESVQAAAVSAFGGSEEFNITRDPARSSLLEPNWPVVSRHGGHGGYEVVDRRSVPSIALADLAAAAPSIDVLRLDCQGVEYQLLSSALPALSRSAAVEVAGGLVDNYAGQYPFIAVEALLRAAGYCLVSLETWARPRDGFGGLHQPLEYRGLWLKDQGAQDADLGFHQLIKVLLLSKAYGHLSFGQATAAAMMGRSLLPAGLASVLTSAGFWRDDWHLGEIR